MGVREPLFGGHCLICSDSLLLLRPFPYESLPLPAAETQGEQSHDHNSLNPNP